MNIIIHSNGKGPDHQRLDRVLAIKNIPWSFNRVNLKTLSNFPGGDEGVPVLQVNRCFFVGSLVSMVALEQLKPDPTLFPNGNCGMPLALAWWSDDFFKIVQRQPDSNFLQKYCRLISRQIADGRPFLQGSQPGLADVHSFAPLWALKENAMDMSMVHNDPLLAPWYQRMSEIRTNRVQEISMTPDDLRLNASEGQTDYPDCDDLVDRENLTWNDQGTIFLWRPPFVAEDP